LLFDGFIRETQAARGQIVVNEEKMSHGDGLAASGEGQLSVCGDGPAEGLLFDLA